jgi:hypothetical protein
MASGSSGLGMGSGLGGGQQTQYSQTTQTSQFTTGGVGGVDGGLGQQQQQQGVGLQRQGAVGSGLSGQSSNLGGSNLGQQRY